jgi:diguanylate cyclase (GGDEF)-like protein
MADIDHFKQFNDLHGHAIGDQVIRSVARTLSVGLRQQDVLCRYGGEEFCIVLPDAPPEVALSVAERLRIAIEAHARGAVRGADVKTVTASFGVSTRAMGARTLEELIDQADQSLYKSKQAGRNRVTMFERGAA